MSGTISGSGGGGAPSRPQPAPRKRKKRSTVAVNLWKPMAYFLMLITSPFAVLVDTFRRTGRAKSEWLFAFSLLLTLVMLMTGVCLLVAEGHNIRIFSLLGNFAATQERLGENLAFSQDITYYAMKNNLDPLLVYAIIDQESRFDRLAVSPRNARGLMQILPATWRELNPNGICSGDHDRYQCHTTDCIFSPGANISAGTRYLARLIKKFNGDIGFALEAYNAGSETVDTVGGSQHPYPETRNYTRGIADKLKRLRQDRVVDLMNLAINARRALVWMGLATLALWGILLAWILRKL